MKNRYPIILLILVILCGEIAAQSIGKRWMIIQDVQDKTVYIDTTNIRYIDNQLSVWTLINYRDAKEINPFQQEASRVKSHFLINPVKLQYSIIGTLYYDATGKIIGESSTPRFTGGIDNFTLPIQNGSTIELVMKKGREFLENGNVTVAPSGYDPTKDKPAETQEPIQKIVTPVTQNNNYNKPAEQPDSIDAGANIVSQADENNIPLIPKLNKDGYPVTAEVEIPIEETIPVDTAQADEKTTEPVVEETISEEPEEYKYDADNERIVKNMIFTDGVKYCVQVSSWKTESVAKNEVARLTRNGYNAFIVKAYLAKKRATYNRVRVGYFDTLQEAQRVQRKVR